MRVHLASNIKIQEELIDMPYVVLYKEFTSSHTKPVYWRGSSHGALLFLLPHVTEVLIYADSRIMMICRCITNTFMQIVHPALAVDVPRRVLNCTKSPLPWVFYMRLSPLPQSPQFPGQYSYVHRLSACCPRKFTSQLPFSCRTPYCSSVPSENICRF
jgi:hypothetical protein